MGLDDDPGVSTKYLLASLESDLDSITEEDQVGLLAVWSVVVVLLFSSVSP